VADEPVKSGWRGNRLSPAARLRGRNTDNNVWRATIMFGERDMGGRGKDGRKTVISRAILRRISPHRPSLRVPTTTMGVASLSLGTEP